MKKIISLSILGVTVLGFIIYFIISKMAQDDTIFKSFQLPQGVSPSKSAFSQSERIFLPYPVLKDYAVIAENNIFRPLGWRRELQSPGEPAVTVTPELIVQIPPPLPTYTLVLTGIAKNGSDWIAVIEDRKRAEGTFLRRGATLKDGRLVIMRAFSETIEPKQLHRFTIDIAVDANRGASIIT